MSEICDYIPEHHNARIVRRVFGKFNTAIGGSVAVPAAAGSRITILSICAIANGSATLIIQGSNAAGAAQNSVASSDLLSGSESTAVSIVIPTNTLQVNISAPEGLGLFSLPDGQGLHISTATAVNGFFSISYIVSKINSTLNMV